MNNACSFLIKLFERISANQVNKLLKTITIILEQEKERKV